jgi:hypothetical protein
VTPIDRCGDTVCNCGETAGSCPGDCTVVCPTSLSLATWTSGDDGWTKDGAWRRESSAMKWGSSSSYNSSYTHYLTYASNVDLSGCASAWLTFVISLSDDSSWDSESSTDKNQKLYVECSGDGGGSWLNMTAPTLPTAQTTSSGCTTYYCDGNQSINRSFSSTGQTWTLPAGCRTASARFRFRANGTTAWDLNNPGWTVDTVTVN